VFCLGHPVADVFAIIARDNCCFMALADGVNWGDRSRLAARCAVRGAIDHLNERLIDGVDRNTEVCVFVEIYIYI
jgi:hypothetical protein